MPITDGYVGIIYEKGKGDILFHRPEQQSGITRIGDMRESVKDCALSYIILLTVNKRKGAPGGFKLDTVHFSGLEKILKMRKDIAAYNP
jgi:hypothetical protein